MAVQPALSDAEQQEKLRAASDRVNGHCRNMRESLGVEKSDKLMSALRFCSLAVSELKIGDLRPKYYYELYLKVFESVLTSLASYLRQHHPDVVLADLYELVQYVGNVLPRLYLMFTVGSVFMSTPGAPVKEIMKDMMEMNRGIQHPIRSLFLRYYLLGQVRSHLPTGTSDGPDGNLDDSISFLLTNFIEMNKLWVRYRDQCHSRDLEKREIERDELKGLVGTNLACLSELVDLHHYKRILGPILEQVKHCRDRIAQEYLLDAMTQVFPDQFHLATLEQFLSIFTQLNPEVNVKKIMTGIIGRLKEYILRDVTPLSDEKALEREIESVAEMLANLNSEEPAVEGEKMESKGPAVVIAPLAQESPWESGEREADEAEPEEVEPSTDEAAKPEEEKQQQQQQEEQPKTDDDDDDVDLSKVKLFEIFIDQISHLPHLSVADTVELMDSLAQLAIAVYPDRIDLVNQVLGLAIEKVSQHAGSAELFSTPTQDTVKKLVMVPFESYKSVFTALAIPNLVPLIYAQPYPTRLEVAQTIARRIIHDRVLIRTMAQLDDVFSVLSVLVQAPSGGVTPAGPGGRLASGQGLLARIIHLVAAPNNDDQLRLLIQAQMELQKGNERVKYTSPALLTAYLKLARAFKAETDDDDEVDRKVTPLFGRVRQLIQFLHVKGVNVQDLVLRLYDQSARIADQLNVTDFTLDFYEKAIQVYEEDISDSRDQMMALCILTRSLHSIRSLPPDECARIFSSIAQRGSRLLKKRDQSFSVMLSSHLFWPTPARLYSRDGVAVVESDDDDYLEKTRKGRLVLECLQRALLMADKCVDKAVSVEMFIKVLNRFMYYYDERIPQIEVKYLNSLIELIQSHITSSDPNVKLYPISQSIITHFERTLAYIQDRNPEGLEVNDE